MKKIFNKSLALVIAVALCVSAMVGCFTASAENGTGTIIVSSDATAIPGGADDVSITLASATGICAARFLVTFDSDLTLASITSPVGQLDYKHVGNTVSGAPDVTDNGNGTSSIMILIMADSDDSNTVTSFASAGIVLGFDVAADAELGNKAVSVSNVDACSAGTLGGADEVTIDLTATNGYLAVSDHQANLDVWAYDATNHWHPCTDNGCADKYNEAPHAWNAGEVTTVATPFVEGVMTYTCEVCGATKTEAIKTTIMDDIVLECEDGAVSEFAVAAPVTGFEGSTLVDLNGANITLANAGFTAFNNVQLPGDGNYKFTLSYDATNVAATTKVDLIIDGKRFAFPILAQDELPSALGTTLLTAEIVVPVKAGAHKLRVSTSTDYLAGTVSSACVDSLTISTDSPLVDTYLFECEEGVLTGSCADNNENGVYDEGPSDYNIRYTGNFAGAVTVGMSGDSDHATRHSTITFNDVNIATAGIYDFTLFYESKNEKYKDADLVIDGTTRYCFPIDVTKHDSSWATTGYTAVISVPLTAGVHSFAVTTGLDFNRGLTPDPVKSVNADALYVQLADDTYFMECEDGTITGCAQDHYNGDIQNNQYAPGITSVGLSGGSSYPTEGSTVTMDPINIAKPGMYNVILCYDTMLEAGYTKEVDLIVDGVRMSFPLDQENLPRAWRTGYFYIGVEVPLTAGEHTFAVGTPENYDRTVVKSVNADSLTVKLIDTDCVHVWDAGVVTTPATYSADGVMTYTCTICGETRTEVIPMLVCTEHVWDAGVVTTPATTETEGVMTYTCTICGETKTEVIPVLPPVVYEDANLKMRGAGVTLANGFDLDFKVRKTMETSLGYSDIYIEFAKPRYDAAGNVVETRTTTVLAIERKDDPANAENYLYTLAGIQPQEIGTMVSATIYGTKDGHVYKGATVNYSVLTFATNQLKTLTAASTATSTQIACADLINYGAAVQAYASYNTANSIVAAADALCGSSVWQGFATSELSRDLVNAQTNTPLEGATVRIRSAGVTLSSKVILFFNCADLGVTTLANRDNYAVRVNYSNAYGDSRSYTLDIDENNQALLDTLYSTELSTAVTACIVDRATGDVISNTVTYSIETFISKNSTTPWCDALIKYGDSVRNLAGLS